MQANVLKMLLNHDPENCVSDNPSRLTAAKAADSLSSTEFHQFLIKNRLHTLWLKRMEQGDFADQQGIINLLKQYRTSQIAYELAQKSALSLAHHVLNQAEISYFIAKGAHLRETLYSDPWLRPCVDIDLYINESDRNEVIELLTCAGFEPRPLPETISHELKLSKNSSDIDLHWHFLRPGRYHPYLMTWFFSRRQKFGDFWGLDATASLLVMLVHPAITKYVISPTSMLIHQVDQARLINSGQVDWNELENALKISGLKTAAWSSLYFLGSMTGIHAPEGFEEKLAPGKVHAFYLKQWIDRGWITKWFDKRRFVAGFFNLALQDSVQDAVRALRLRSQMV